MTFDHLISYSEKENTHFSLKRVQEDIHKRFVYIFSDCPYPGTKIEQPSD